MRAGYHPAAQTAGQPIDVDMRSPYQEHPAQEEHSASRLQNVDPGHAIDLLSPHNSQADAIDLVSPLCSQTSPIQYLDSQPVGLGCNTKAANEVGGPLQQACTACGDLETARQAATMVGCINSWCPKAASSSSGPRTLQPSAPYLPNQNQHPNIAFHATAGPSSYQHASERVCHSKTVRGVNSCGWVAAYTKPCTACARIHPNLVLTSSGSEGSMMGATDEIVKQLQREELLEAIQRAKREQSDAAVAASLMQQEQHALAQRKAREAQVFHCLLLHSMHATPGRSSGQCNLVSFPFHFLNSISQTSRTYSSLPGMHVGLKDGQCTPKERDVTTC